MRRTTTVEHKGRLYALLDFGTLSCYDAATGKPLYERQRIPEGRAFTASPWACNGKVFCVNEDGATFVFRDGEKFELLRVNRLAEDDMGMATPAMAGGSLILRTSARLYCIRAGR